MIIAIQGAQASFHDIAARQFFGEAERVYCDSFASTIAALQSDDADFAMCAIENSIHGSINEVYDLIADNDLYIVGEVYIRIAQCLVGLPDASIKTVTSVYSHPVALSQCDAWLSEQLPVADRHEYHDTAAAVEHIVELADVTAAAIASKEAAALYGGVVLAEEIETDKENYTRFVVISKERTSYKSDPNKTSLVLRTDHSAGALHKALGVFAQRGISLSKIESRPILGKAWHYKFYVDVAISSEDARFTECEAELEGLGCTMKLLGSYRSMHG